MFNKKIELRHAINNLFCGVELHPFAEEIVEHLNCGHLAQAIQHFAQTVYAYAIWTEEASSCEYRGEQLFPFPATLLYAMPQMISASESGIISERIIELWLTDDMKFVVVSNQRTDFNDGEFVSEYRTIKTKDQDEFSQVFELDYNLLALVLQAMSKEYVESGLPTYEL